MKTCRLYATSFVSPIEFLSSEVFYELLLLLLNIIPADVKVASLINPANLKKKRVWKQIENVSTALLLFFRRTIEINNYIHEWTLISSLMCNTFWKQ